MLQRTSEVAEGHVEGDFAVAGARSQVAVTRGEVIFSAYLLALISDEGFAEANRDAHHLRRAAPSIIWNEPFFATDARLAAAAQQAQHDRQRRAAAEAA